MEALCKMITTVTGDDMYVYSHNNNRQYKKTMKGWKLCAKWKDGTTSWHQLADLIESYQIVVAEFAVTQGIHDEPAFHMVGTIHVILA
jgi:hypothetical protein